MRGQSPKMFSASLLSIALLLGNNIVSAQGNSPHHPLPGITIKACEVEGTMIADFLNLSDQQKTKLIDTYKIAREKVMEERAQLAKYVGVDYKYVRQSMDAERTKMETSLRKFLSSEQTNEATMLLAGFNRRGDTMAMLIDGTPLNAKSKTEVAKRFLHFIAESDTLLQTATDEKSYEAARRKVDELKKALDLDLEKIFSVEQMDRWRNVTERTNRNSYHGSNNDQSDTMKE